MRLPSVMSHSFSQAPQATIPRAKFIRNCGYKTTFDAGYLIPFFVDEVLPGDTFDLKATLFGRLATPINPFMDNLYLDTFFFAVPNRILWENWERFNGAQDNPDDPTDFLIPQVVSDEEDGFLAQTIFDYFALPLDIPNLSVSALPFRAYNMIYNEWFRDENLQDSVPFNIGDGPDDPADYELLRRAKRYDYFSSALPWPQKGPAVTLPLSGDAPVYLDPASVGDYQLFRRSSDHTLYSFAGAAVNISGSSNPPESRIYASADSWVVDPNGTLLTDMSGINSFTINALREAFQLQKLLERDARGGTRYFEILQSHFGITSPDSRLQRPEYLGGGTSYVNLHPLAQTSSSDMTSPQANLAAFGTVSAQGHGFVKSFVEHSVIIGLVSVRADLNYQQGLDRMWSRRSRFDFYWPALSHLGEQAILNKEIYCQGTSADDEVFGYQERYAEYRYKPSKVTSQMRSSFPQSLDTWHLAQDFESLPTLGPEFIVEDPPVDRVKALADEYPDFLLDSYFRLACTRPMPVYSVPGFVDHF